VDPNIAYIAFGVGLFAGIICGAVAMWAALTDA
jgi:hypothetical protein